MAATEAEIEQLADDQRQSIISKPKSTLPLPGHLSSIQHRHGPEMT